MSQFALLPRTPLGGIPWRATEGVAFVGDVVLQAVGLDECRRVDPARTEVPSVGHGPSARVR